MTAVDADFDDHPFLGGRLMLRQMCSGHRAGTDACLLAAALDLRDGECVADVGAGVGAAGLAALSRAPGARAILVERDVQACMLAQHNAAANGMSHRVQVVADDVFERSALAGLGLLRTADAVITNPPFYVGGDVRASPDRSRADAHVLEGHSPAEWLNAAVRLARPRGRLAMIHKPEALPGLLQSWPREWGGILVRWIHPFEHRAATRMLLAATSGSRASLTVLPPLVLHDRDGTFTSLAQAIHRGTIDSPLMKRPA